MSGGAQRGGAGMGRAGRGRAGSRPGGTHADDGAASRVGTRAHTRAFHFACKLLRKI